MKQILSFCFFAFLFCFSSCETEKDRDRLKEAFFCTINGEEFYPQKLIGTNWYNIYYNKNITENEPSLLFIGVQSDRFRYAEIIIGIYSNKESIGVGEYILKDPYISSDIIDFNNIAYGYCHFQNKNEKEIKSLPDKYNYNTTLNTNGYVNITKIDLLEKTITGTFHFTAVNNNGDVLSVQNGRFNTKYR